MPWARFESNYPLHPKVANLSNVAFRIHATSICVAVLNGSGQRLSSVSLGVVLATLPTRKGALRAVDQLIEVGLFERDPDDPKGVIIHDFLDYNFGPEKKLHELKLNRDRQRRFRESRKDNAVTNDDVTSLGHDLPSPPLPSLEEEEEAAGRESREGPGLLGISGNGNLPPEGCGKCVTFGTGIGWNQTIRKPCHCALGRWRSAHKQAHGAWPVGPDKPALARGGRVAPTLTPELEELLARVDGEPEPELDQELPL